MARHSRLTGRPVTYHTINKETGISPNTLSKMAKNKLKMVGLSTIDDLCGVLDCEPGDLIVRVSE